MCPGQCCSVTVCLSVCSHCYVSRSVLLCDSVFKSVHTAMCPGQCCSVTVCLSVCSHCYVSGSVLLCDSVFKCVFTLLCVQVSDLMSVNCKATSYWLQ